MQKDMNTEYEKMLNGEVYNAIDKSLLTDLNLCKDLCWEYNQIRPTLIKERNKKLHEILASAMQTRLSTSLSFATMANTSGLANVSLPTLIGQCLMRLW